MVPAKAERAFIFEGIGVIEFGGCGLESGEDDEGASARAQAERRCMAIAGYLVKTSGRRESALRHAKFQSIHE